MPAQRSPLPKVEVVELGIPESKAPDAKDWAKLRFKLASALVGGLVLLIGGGVTYAVTYLSTKTEAQKATKKAEVAATGADKAVDRTTVIEKYLRDDAAYRACVDHQVRDALSRGTGHVITALPKDGVEWAEQNAPKAVPRTIWTKPTWFPIETCPTKPAPPSSPP